MGDVNISLENKTIVETDSVEIDLGFSGEELNGVIIDFNEKITNEKYNTSSTTQQEYISNLENIFEEGGKSRGNGPTFKLPRIPGIPSFMLSFHPNLFDILYILFFILKWLKRKKRPKKAKNRKEYFDGINSILKEFDFIFSEEYNRVGHIIPSLEIEVIEPEEIIVSLRGGNKNKIFEMIHNRYDSNNELDEINDFAKEAIFELSFNNYPTEDINKLILEYENFKKNGYTSGKLRRARRV